MFFSCVRDNLLSLLFEVILYKFCLFYMIGWVGKNFWVIIFVNFCIVVFWEVFINIFLWFFLLERVFFDVSFEKKLVIWEEVRKFWLLKMWFFFELIVVSIECVIEVGLIFFFEFFFCWNLFVINFFCLLVNLIFLEVFDLRV